MARLRSIELTNFKNVGHGVVEFPSTSRPFEADILGIYGQNGSGKTAVIEALDILQSILLGMSLEHFSTDCIRFGFDEAELQIELDVQKDNTRQLKTAFVAYYSVTLKCEDGKLAVGKERLSYSNCEKPRKSLLLEHESLGKETDLPARFSTVPKTTWASVFSADDELATEYAVLERVARKERTSLVFAFEFMELLFHMFEALSKREIVSENVRKAINFTVVPLIDAVACLRDFARKLTVLTTVNNARASLNRLAIAPLRNPEEPYLINDILLDIDEPTVLGKSELAKLEATVKAINVVLSSLVPNLTLAVQPLGDEMKEDGSIGSRIEMVSHRGDCTLPFRCESEGIKKIVSILGHLIDVYNDENCCVAIDELDSGIFEFLLGELLEVLAEHGKGQLIFTAHNLRPLETLPTRSLVFTTTNPDRRYIGFTGIRPSNNLRDKYLRAVNLGGQSETIYEPTSKYEIDAAFCDAGCIEAEAAEEGV